MRTDHWAAITARAATQHGMVSTAQVRATGAGRQTLQRAVARGLLVPVRRGVLCVAGSPPSVWQSLQGALLTAGPRVVASHDAAAGLYGFPGFVPGAVELTCVAGRPLRLEGATCHFARGIRPVHLDVVGGFRVTGPALTLLDLAGRVSPYLLAKTVDFACRRRLCSLGDLQRCLDQVGGQGRVGTAALRRVLADRMGGDSDLEGRWLRILGRAGRWPPALQHQVVAGRRVLILDFAWPAQRVGIEVDGWDPHRDRSVWDHDHDKVNAYLEAGWRVLFVTSNTPPGDVLRQLDRFLSR